MELVRKLIALTIALVSRYPWAIAIFGFVSGVASFFLVEREQEKFAQMVSALMLLSWVWLTLESLLRRGVAHWFGWQLPPPVLSFATQLVHQESLFFVIPFFFITTSWNSGQMFFTSLLIVSAFISIVDPIYYRWLAARRWLYFIFHGITLFAVLLTALPIIFQLPTPKTYLLSLIIAILLTLPGVMRALPFAWWKRILVALLLVALVWFIGILVRTWIPPATLRLTEVAITDRINDENRSPENELKVVTVEQLRTGLYAYTAIRAPRGLNERIYHVWRLNNLEVDRIALDINGGREAGYRAWSHKMNFPPYPKGRWQIHVVTEANQVIGVLRFQVVESFDEEGERSDKTRPQENLLQENVPVEIDVEHQGDIETSGDLEEPGDSTSADDASSDSSSVSPSNEDSNEESTQSLPENPDINSENSVDPTLPNEAEQKDEVIEENSDNEKSITQEPNTQEQTIEQPTNKDPVKEESQEEKPREEKPQEDKPEADEPTEKPVAKESEKSSAQSQSSTGEKEEDTNSSETKKSESQGVESATPPPE